MGRGFNAYNDAPSDQARWMEPEHRMTPSGIPFAIYGRPDETAVEQLIRCLEKGSARRGVLCADHHVGYSMPIGGVAAYEHHISPTGVGVDIGCGVKGVRTDLQAADVDIAGIMDDIENRVNFGMGGSNHERADHPILDKIKDADFVPQRSLMTMAADQLGTVGGGNHWVDLFEDRSDGSLWVGAHFGSRGFGFKTANGFLALAEGMSFSDKPKGEDMFSDPVLLDTRTELGQSYLAGMFLAQEYAAADRDVVIERVLSILGAKQTFDVHECHNFGWQEEHDGEELWVIRKGATPASPGQMGMIGGSMGTDTFVVAGTDSPDMRYSLGSTVHGAGRQMSRTEARGKTKWKRHWVCPERGCDTARPVDLDGEDSPGSSICEAHPGAELVKAKRPILVAEGKVDWDKTREKLRRQGVHLRGGAADEAPDAYKPIEEVLRAHGNTIDIEHQLRPVGVAMAPSKVADPYK